MPNDVVHATRLPFDPGSPGSASYVEGSWSPALLLLRENRRQKQPVIQRRIQPARSAEGPFSLRRGLESELWFLKLGITPWLSLVIWSENDEGDPMGPAGTSRQRLDPAADSSYLSETAARPHGVKKITALPGPCINP